MDMILQTVNCFELTLGLQVPLTTHKLVWSLQSNSIVYNTPMNCTHLLTHSHIHSLINPLTHSVLINNDIVVLLIFKESNSEEEGDEARYVDVPCEIIAYDIAQQQTTVYHDYHTTSIDNHHLLPININIDMNTYTGSLAVIHSNQFIKFYYYGSGYAGASVASSFTHSHTRSHTHSHTYSRTSLQRFKTITIFTLWIITYPKKNYLFHHLRIIGTRHITHSLIRTHSLTHTYSLTHSLTRTHS